MKFVFEAVAATGGGVKAGMLHLIPLLAGQKGHQFVFLLPNLSEYAGLNAPGAKMVLRDTPRSLLRRDLFLNHTLPALCVEERADALLCFGNFAPRRPTVPTVVMLQNAYYLYREPIAEARATLREKMIIRYGQYHLRHLPARVHVIVQTEVMKRRIVTLNLRQPEQVTVIRDRERLPEEWLVPMPGQTDDPSRPFTFLALGHYGPHKNLEILVDAFKKLPSHSGRPARCLITVNPFPWRWHPRRAPQRLHPGARRLIRRIEEEKLQQVLVNLGMISGPQVEQAYRSADAFLMPTLLESFARIYHEALQFGLPILTSDRDFAHDACQDAALYFDPLDADSVARSMARMMEDGELRARLAQNAKRLISESPTWDEIAAQFVSVLEKAANTPREMA
jgi:glycosyltransferase involved in cell wall biosynthesis